jgi:hypothetical protein
MFVYIYLIPLFLPLLFSLAKPSNLTQAVMLLALIRKVSVSSLGLNIDCDAWDSSQFPQIPTQMLGQYLKLGNGLFLQQEARTAQSV